MLDIRFIKENEALCRQRLAQRGRSYDEEIDRILALDEKRRALIATVEEKKAEQNRVSKRIPQMKKAGEDVAPVLAEMKAIAEQVKGMDAQLSDIEQQLRTTLLEVPNVPAERVPVGADDSDNPVLRTWGEPTAFPFEPQAHWDIGDKLGILDPGRAGKVTGSRFHFYRGLGARLERAVINYYLDTHTSRGYTEILPPFLANSASMTGTGQLPKFADDMFHVENTDYYLIPTAEVPVTNLHRDEILEREQMPIHYCAYSACFRGEGGSAGRDQRGLIRQHQFNKVELVKFCNPEDSWDELESLTRDAEFVLQGLGLPHRVVCLCTGDLGFSSACTYDIEVWMPSYGRYVEISSCSNFLDYQARRAGIRVRDEKGKPRPAHTLNGSGVAIGRSVAAILENYQNGDGSVTVPEVLRKYMGVDVIR